MELCGIEERRSRKALDSAALHRGYLLSSHTHRMETRKNLIAQLLDCGVYRRGQVFQLGFIDDVRRHHITG